jgi:integrase
MGEPGPGDKKWTEDRARKAALSMLGAMSAGVDPRATATTGEGVTLQQGLDLHVATMRKKKRSARSIKSITDEVSKHFAAWLDRPLVELTADAVEKVCVKAKRNAKARAGAANPPGLALENRLLAHVSAIWRAADRRYDMEPKNPATRLDKNALKPRKERINKGEFADWYAKVQALSPVRRDLQLFVLFTALRSESARELEWTDIDRKEGLIRVKKVKGDKPYIIPLTATVAEILERRRKENAIQFAPYGGDHGLVFPTITRAKPYKVKPLAEPREVREGAKHLPGLHPSRRTWNSVALEIAIPGEHRLALMNHQGAGVNIKHYDSRQNWDALAASAAAVERALLDQLGLKEKPKKRRKRKRSE